MTDFEITGAIFDLDGTLLDSMFIWDRLGEDYLKSKGIYPLKGLKSDLKNISLLQSAQYFRERYGITDSCEKIIDDIGKLSENFYFNEVKPKEGVVKILEAFKRKNVRMCIATATERRLAEGALKRCGFLDYFSGIITCSEVGEGKDKPDIFIKALEILKTNNENTFVFEDSAYAAKTAFEAGFRVCGVYDDSEKNISELMQYSEVYIKSFMEAGDFFD